MTAPELIEYLERLGFIMDSYTSMMEFITLHLRDKDIGANVNNLSGVSISICKSKGVYHQQYSDKPNIFSIKYELTDHIDFNTKMPVRSHQMNHYTIDGVLEFLVENRIGKPDVLREAIIELNCHRLLN
jgi:hypothetical protein